MEDTVFLVNQRASILDLSAVTDVTGRRVVLEPAGSLGARRECFAATEGHPHVQTMLGARWLRVERHARAAPTAIAPTTEGTLPAELPAHPGESGSTTTAAAPPEEAMDPAAAEPTHDSAEVPGEQRRGKKR